MNDEFQEGDEVSGDLDRQPLSTLDAAFLFLERPNQPFQIGCVAMLERSMPLEELLETLDERLDSLRRFRQIPARVRLDLAWPTWQDDPSFDLRRHVRHVAVPPPGDREKLLHVIETLYSTPLAADQPLWEIHLIDGIEGGRAALLCKVHHCMIDGISGFKVLETLADPPRNGATTATLALPPAEEDAPAVRRSRRKGTVAALLEALQDPAKLLRRRARDLAEAVGTIAGFVEEPATPAPFNGPLKHSRRVVWRSFPFDEFASLRTAAACTINDAALAVIAGALRRHLGEHDIPAEESCIRVVVPMNLRTPGRELELGNQVTAIFPRLPVHIADPVERLHRMREEMRLLKLRGQAGATSLVLALAGALPSVTEASILRALPDFPVVNSLCTNVTGPKRTLRLAGRKMMEIHAIAPLFLNVGLSFAVASYAGQISICAIADPSLVPDLEAIGNGLEESLYETRTALWQRSQALAVAHRLATGPTVEELMSRDFVTIGANDSLQRAEEIMRERRVSHVPVVDHGLRLLGVLTQRDLLFASSAQVGEPNQVTEPGRSLSRSVATWVARSKLTVAAPNEAAFDAGRRMVEHELDFLPVVDDTGRLLGLVTGEHILRWTTKRATA